MEAEELAKKLKDMYLSSAEGETAVSIHLFGIKHAIEIKECGVAAKKLAKLAGVPESYGTEINKGQKLAKYVRLK